MVENFGNNRKINTGKALLLSSFLTAAALFSAHNKLEAQAGSSAQILSTEQVHNVFTDLDKDFSEKRKMFDSGEGKAISPNQSMYLEKDGVNYFLINPESGEKFMVSLVRDLNSNTLVFELNDKRGYYVFAKGFGMVTNEDVVSKLEAKSYEDRIIVLDELRFKFILTANKEGTEVKKTMFGQNEDAEPSILNNYLGEFSGGK